MDALRQIVDRKTITHSMCARRIRRQGGNNHFSDSGRKKMSATSEAMLNLQEQTGFAKHVLEDENEDVWNDL